ncbi:flagellar basal body-associated FliL family protein [Vibrio alfacsensis]|uniref:flagellar basal body-associated FliL family protein n=1 Tax=Vibrio alfacsensis TaxID=1074311 RepID=UPI004068A831
MTKKQMIALFITMIITSALVSAATVASGIWYLNKSTQASSSATGALLDLSSLPFMSQEAPKSETPSFHPLEKVVLTIKGKKQSHFVMLELAIETRNAEGIKDIDNYMPVVKNSLLKLFSDKTFDELQKHGSIESLQTELKQTLLLAFEETDIVHDIDDVLLTKYVVQ